MWCTLGAMKLATYLETNALSDAAFAETIGVDRTTVMRLRHRGQIPTVPIMKKIADVTEGAVTANDFFGIEAQPSPHQQSAA